MSNTIGMELHEDPTEKAAIMKKRKITMLKNRNERRKFIKNEDNKGVVEDD